MKELLNNDKFFVTAAVLILGIGAYIWSYYTNTSAENIITAIVSGLFGMTAGIAMGIRGNKQRKGDVADEKE